MKVLDNMPITWTDHEDVALQPYEQKLLSGMLGKKYEVKLSALKNKF